MTAHPKSYRSAIIEEKGGAFKLVDVAWKDPAVGQVVVKTLACGVCQIGRAHV